MGLFFFCLCTVAAAVLVSSPVCKTLIMRSIAKGQPFQLPIEKENEEEEEPQTWDPFIEILNGNRCGIKYEITPDNAWISVTQNTCTHVELLDLFKCT